MDLSDAVRLSRIEKDALRRRGLAGINVGHDADVPATLQWDLSGHSFLLLFLPAFFFPGLGLVYFNDRISHVCQIHSAYQR
jgi:hypothetical protein